MWGSLLVTVEDNAMFEGKFAILGAVILLLLGIVAAVVLSG